MDIGAHAVHCVGVTDVERIESLEQVVRALHPEVLALRAEVDRLRAEVRGTAPTAAPRAADRPPAADPPGAARTAGEARGAEMRAGRTPKLYSGVAPGGAGRRVDVATLDLEAMIGRYGTLALATLTILLGVGAFVGWAISHHLLGPTVRVALGALLAAGLAVTGWRLRRTGAVPFSNAVLGLALAVVHVDAWGAGPYLHLITPSQALTVAALASVVLSAFARLERDQVLFSIGVGGALLAPFVTSDGAAHVIPLLLFGFIVLELALTTLRDADWTAALYVVAGGCVLYTGAGLAATSPGDPASLALAPAVFAVAFAVAALVVPPRRHRTLLAQSALTQLVLALSTRTELRFAIPVTALAALGTASAYATLWLETPASDITTSGTIAVVLLPLASMSVAMVTMHDRTSAAIVAAGWAAAAAAMAAIDRRERRGAHITVAGIASGVAITIFLVESHPLLCVAALSAHAAILTMIMWRRQEAMVAVPTVIGLALSTALTFTALSDRVAYHYVPFATRESAAALALSAACLLFSWYASRLASSAPHPLVRVAGLVVTFFWCRAELADAVSADAATFFLIAFYAIVGVGAVFLGRARDTPVLRHAGLALAIFAAIKAVIEATGLAVGLRISSYFLAGLFMLAVAYWYRAADVNRTSS